jgi:hypothetical protein
MEPLSNAPPRPATSLDERLEQLEQLRRIGFALAGVPYPEGPTPKHERRKWPVERIGCGTVTMTAHGRRDGRGCRLDLTAMTDVLRATLG